MPDRMLPTKRTDWATFSDEDLSQIAPFDLDDVGNLANLASDVEFIVGERHLTGMALGLLKPTANGTERIIVGIAADLTDQALSLMIEVDLIAAFALRDSLDHLIDAAITRNLPAATKDTE
jgi:hypothetical protein